MDDKFFNSSLNTSKNTLESEIYSLYVNRSKSTGTSPKTQSKAIPYINFFKKYNSERGIFNYEPDLQRLSEIYEKLPADQKGDIQIETTAKRFAEYWASLGEERSDEILDSYTQIIKDIFAVDIDRYAAASSLCVIIKEMLCVPKDVASSTCQYESSPKSAIKRQIKRDIIAENEKISVIGFSKSLLPEDIYYPPINCTKENWIILKDIPADVENMSVVWEGITGLKSTRDYYKWAKKTKKNVPEYLKMHGLKCEEVRSKFTHHRVSATLPDVLIKQIIEKNENMKF